MYKARRVPFSNKENYGEKRESRAREKVNNRRLSRQKNYAKNRNIALDSTQKVSHDDQESEKLSRYEQLLRWKREKERLKNREKKTKEKPPFKCGSVHYKPPPILESECRRSTRLKSMKDNSKQEKISVAMSSNITRRRRNDQPPSGNKTCRSFAPVSHQFKAPNNLPKIDEICMSVSEPADAKEHDRVFSISFPAQMSPWISKSRGSDGGKVSPSCKGKNETSLSHSERQTPIKVVNASKGTPENLRKFVGRRLIQQSLNSPGEPVQADLSRTTTPVLSKGDADDLLNFRSQYEREVDRLDGLCKQWDVVLSSETCQEIPVHVQDNIRATVGQTRLLMREKLAQFNDLLNKFKLKSSKSFQVITSSDLQGFWDLVSIQVNDVDAKFTSLDALKWNNWVVAEEPKNLEKPIISKKGVNTRNSKTKNPTAAKSAFKAYIAEQRKRMKDPKANGSMIGSKVESTDTFEEEKTNDTMTSPQLNASINNNTNALKRRFSQRLSFKRGLDHQGGSITPKKSSKRVTFAETTPLRSPAKGKARSSATPYGKCSKGTPVLGNMSCFVLVKSPNLSAAEGDLISWESPA